MTCGTIEKDLSALLDGELTAVEERRIRDHLALCSRCRAAFEEMRRTSHVLRSWDRGHETRPSGAFVSRVVRRVREGSGKTAARRRPRSVLAPLLAVAAGLLLVAGAALWSLVPAGEGPAPAGASAFGPRAEYSRRAAAVDPGDAAGHLALAKWCRRAGLSDLAACEELLAFAADPDDPAVRRALPDLVPGEVEVCTLPTIRVEPLPDLGGPLPPVPPLKVSPDDRYRGLGMVKAGGRWFTAEAYRAFRERREQESLLAREMDRKRQLLAKRRVEVAPDTTREPVVAWLASLTPASPVSVRGITVVPLLDGTADCGISLLTLPEALAKKVIDIREDTGSARLVAVNRDPRRHVFLAAGDILSGGYQDRILTRDTLIPPKTTAGLPVLCCERERMIGATSRFGSTPGLAPAGIRAALVSATNQDVVWHRIARGLAALGAGSPTHALAAIYRTGGGAKELAGYLRDLRRGLEDARTVGFLVFAGDRLLGGDVFGGHDLLTRLAPRSLGSFVLEALQGKHRGTPQTDPRALLATVREASFLHRRAAVMGEEAEFGGGGSLLSGAALLPAAGLPPLHVSLFPASEEPETRARGENGAPPEGTGGAGPEPRDRSRAGRRIDERRKRRLSGKLPEPGRLKPPDRPRLPGSGNRPPPTKTPSPDGLGR